MDNGGGVLGTYTIPKKENFKSYYIKNDNYVDEHFGGGKVIAPIEETSGNERFYVMALKDVDTRQYMWYHTNQTTTNTKYTFESGRSNTKEMLSKESKQEGTIWKAINGKTGEKNNDPKWFIASREEWAAFGANFNITSGNYNKLGLSLVYWSSSQFETEYAFCIDFGLDGIGIGGMTNTFYGRLATTF